MIRSFFRKRQFSLIFHLVLLGLLGAMVANAQNEGVYLASLSGSEIEHDTTTLINRLGWAIGNSYADSIRLIPAYETYCQWDTTVIHPYHFDDKVYFDTTRLVLVGSTSSKFVMPCPGKTNSNFGPRHKQAHFGVDLHLLIGDTVVGAFDGMVRIAKRNKSYGNVVIIRHANGLESIYAHLSKILVVPNQIISAGTPIGLGGNTGHSFGPHLHFELRYKGEPLNPSDIISFEDKRLISDTATLTYQNFEVYNRLLKAYNARYSRYGKLAKGKFANNRLANSRLANVKLKGKSQTVAKVSASNSATASNSNSTLNSKSSKATTVKTTSSAAAFCTVKKGDTVYSLAKKYHTTPEKLLKLNNLKSSSVLKVGSKLKCA